MATGANAERFTLTRAGYEELSRELEELEALQGELRDSLGEFTAFDPDPMAEEGAYADVRQRKDMNDNRLDHLRDVLARAEVMDDDPDPLTVDPGDRVTVWDISERETVQFDIVGSEEVMSGHKGISPDSPVGRALMGRRVGDVVHVVVPDGRVRYAIRKIERTPVE
jgi:transcription elongation factor GreA